MAVKMSFLHQAFFKIIHLNREIIEETVASADDSLKQEEVNSMEFLD